MLPRPALSAIIRGRASLMGRPVIWLGIWQVALVAAMVALVLWGTLAERPGDAP